MDIQGTTKTANQLKTWIGKARRFQAGPFLLAIRIHDARANGDGVELLVSPLAGEGTIWVKEEEVLR